ncbi:MAG: hypothetical protein AVDCRST_MAG56-3729 [uncultured Cytophagales bacterium]|uniref:Outer membrane protein beta-barrel domain-containing protein n=1 Tax=uncultured Cytophagales bacterium TaxID=158755 RepID=A0A6J4JKP1_9SPHI|nr:MAG: hypothetical protein AVDCRST_MAG56-3729 [uncultured Cytophagales bacterium]
MVMKMTKNFLQKWASAGLVALVLLAAAPANAQNDNPGPSFGVKGGLNLANLFVDEDNIQDKNWKVGYHVGLFVKAPLSNMLSIQPEILYSTAGAKVTYGGSDLAQVLGITPGEVRFNLNYVQVPVMFMVNLGAFNVHAGPYASYLLSANVKNLQNNDPLNPSTALELNESDFQRLDYGLAGGIGFDLKNAKLGLRYNYGLQRIGDGGVAGRIAGDARNAVAQVYVGFGF